MGNTGNKQSVQDEYKNFSLRKSEDVVALGRFDHYEDLQNNLHFLAFESTYAISNPEIAEAEISQLRKLNQLKHGCQLKSTSVGKSQLLCFENYSIKLLFEYYEDNLLTISKIKNPNQLNKETECWRIVTDLVNYLNELMNFGLSHGDLQPKYILFNRNKSVKVISPLIFTSYQNAYKLRLADDDYRSTFSPELLSEHINRVYSPSYDPIRADVFSLGICMLCFVYSENFESYYNFKENTVNFEKIKKQLSQMIQMQYSEELFFIINLCLKQNAYERATLEDLNRIIRKKQQARGEIGNW